MKPIKALFLQMIHRIDFSSHYYLHSFTPKARNIDNIRLLYVRKTHIFAYTPLNDTINIYKQSYFKGLDCRKNYILLMNDNWKLQEYYGDFSVILSTLSVGHLLYNVNYVLQKYSIRYPLINYDIVPINEQNFIFVPLALEITSQQERDLEKKKCGAHGINNFIKRTSDQSVGGDLATRHQLEKPQHNLIIKDFLRSLKKYHNLKLSIYLDNIQEVQSGFYETADDSIQLISEKEDFVYRKMLHELQNFTNLEGINYWLFFSFDNKKSSKSYDTLFFIMGYFAQELSIVAAKHGMASRGMKNYNDRFLKEKFCLKTHDVVGYSLNIFRNNNTSSSLYLN